MDSDEKFQWSCLIISFVFFVIAILLFAFYRSFGILDLSEQIQVATLGLGGGGIPLVFALYNEILVQAQRKIAENCK